MPSCSPPLVIMGGSLRYAGVHGRCGMLPYVLLVYEAEVSKQLQSAMVATGNWEVSSADINAKIAGFCVVTRSLLLHMSARKLGELSLRA